MSDEIENLKKQLTEAESVNKILDKAHADSHARECDLINKLAQVEKHLHWWKITHPNDLAEKLAKADEQIGALIRTIGDDQTLLANSSAKINLLTDTLAKAESEIRRLSEDLAYKTNHANAMKYSSDAKHKKCERLERQLAVAKDSLTKIMSGLTTSQKDVEFQTKNLSHQTLIEIEALENENK